MVMKGKGYQILLALLYLLLLALPSLPDSRVEIHKVRYHTHPSFTRIVIDIGKTREYNFNELKSPDRIYIDIYQAKLNPILHGETFLVRSEYLSQVRVAQKSTSTVRVVVDLNLSKAYYRVWHLPEPFRIIVDVYPSTATLSGSPGYPQPAKSGYSMVRQLGLVVDKVVIDPGHGGDDPGCVGRKGLQEKKVVLDIAKRLQKLLQAKANLEVTLTRESDIYLQPESRTVIANQKQADLFVSIHANASRNRNLRGVETFYLNFSQDPSVTELAARENASSAKSISGMKDIIRKIMQNSKIQESEELARNVQGNLVRCLSQKYGNVRSLGVKGGPFWVLIGGEMPSILVEVSFMSNTQEEARLMNSEYLDRIAQGIYEGIIEYKRALEKGTKR